VVVPDLPGCFSAGDDLDEALAGAEVAAAVIMSSALRGRPIAVPSATRWPQIKPAFSSMRVANKAGVAAHTGPIFSGNVFAGSQARKHLF